MVSDFSLSDGHYTGPKDEVLILVLMEDGLGRKISYLSDNLRISQRKTRYFQCFAQKK